MIDKIVGLVEKLAPIALIGPGGIGKTSIGLTVLHHDRIKQQFGDNRRFIRCDQFTTSSPNFLNRLSKVIGAGVDNPENLASLRPFLSSKPTLIVLDNAESILDPQAADAQEIYAAVEELSQLDNVCLCITSRISTIPPDCKTIEVPTLTIEAARQTFHRIYENREQPGLVDNILDQLAFHPLSITLLATVGHHNKWGMDRLGREWETRRTSMLQTGHNRSLATAIELSLASPTFQELGADAREFLEVIAFFPQGVDENNLTWLFPTIPDGAYIVDKLCILSLIQRSNGFITMLAPLRDYLSPKDPNSSSLLRTARDRYFTRLSVDVDPDKPGFKDTRWITSEDVNVERLLDVFVKTDESLDDVWIAHAGFIKHLFWHKPRLTILNPKIERLPDDHQHKPDCLLQLSRLFDSVGNYPECKQLLSQALNIERRRGRVSQVAQLLYDLSNANRRLGLLREGIQQVKESLEIYKRLGDITGEASCLVRLAYLLVEDRQFDAAEEAATSVINLVPGEGNQFQVCQSHRVLGNIYRSKGEVEKAVRHCNMALGVASSSDWRNELFWAHYALAGIFCEENRFDDAHSHLGHAKSHAVNDAYSMGHAVELEARVWFKRCRVKEARLEAQQAVHIFEKIGAATDAERCKKLLQGVQAEYHLPSPYPPLSALGNLPQDHQGLFLKFCLALIIMLILLYWVNNGEPLFHSAPSSNLSKRSVFEISSSSLTTFHFHSRTSWPGVRCFYYLFFFTLSLFYDRSPPFRSYPVVSEPVISN